MTGPQEQPEDLKLQAYLDGQGSEQARAEAAREIAANPEVQKEIELQARIDDSLRRAFKVPDGPVTLTLPTDAVVAIKSRLRRRRFAIIGLATAATVAWAILGWQFFRNREDAPNYDPNRPFAEIYEEQVAKGFKPIWVCEDDREFASTFEKRQGQAMLLADMPEGTKMEGLTYCGGISRYTTTMLARVDGKPVMILVDRASADTHPSPPPAGSGLHLFRKELGSLVIYELTPLDQPAVMDYLKLAEVPPTK
jgi:hypothetical protein